jgi:uncharacterized membrane protein YecN with MAPEG domain
MIAFHYPYFTAATAVVLAVLQMLLALYVAGGRGRYRAGLGDGGNPKLLQRIRAHGNLAENAPLFLILLALVETSGQWSSLVPLFAGAFIVFRLSHALGLLISSGTSIFRLLGILGTVGSILGLCGLLVRTLAADTHWIPPCLIHHCFS